MTPRGAQEHAIQMAWHYHFDQRREISPEAAWFSARLCVMSSENAEPCPPNTQSMYPIGNNYSSPHPQTRTSPPPVSCSRCNSSSLTRGAGVAELGAHRRPERRHHRRPAAEEELVFRQLFHRPCPPAPLERGLLLFRVAVVTAAAVIVVVVFNKAGNLSRR